MQTPLQLREVFHLEFLRWFSHKVEAKYYALKGGVNLRFFFNSFRYSEDMDLDIYGVMVDTLRDIVMGILCDRSFQQNLKSYNVERIVPPDITKAKQTETTQRFKVHLITFAGEDLFTKIEFSRRGLKNGIIAQSVLNNILRAYKLPPLLVPHYNIQSTVMQKIGAIASRTVIQARPVRNKLQKHINSKLDYKISNGARDILDLYILSSQCKDKDIEMMEYKMIEKNKLIKAYEHIFEVSFAQFQDTVVSYLALEEQNIYKKESSWEEVKLKTAAFIDELLLLLRRRYA